LLVFGDVHYLMALAAAGRADDAARMVESMESYAARGGKTEAAVAGEPGLALVQGVLAHSGTIRRIGGSHAQRDL
jgi:hypothetical protein